MTILLKEVKDKMVRSMFKPVNIPVPLLDRLDEIYNSLPADSIKGMYIEIKHEFDNIRQRLNALWKRAIEEDEIKMEVAIMREIRDTIKDFTKILEDFHIKPKAVDWQAVAKDEKQVTHEYLASLNKEAEEEDEN